MSVSLSDILTAAKNVASAINSAAQNYSNIQGAQNTSAISTTTLIKASAGRACSVSVTTAGSSTGALYDSSLATSLVHEIYVIPAAVGVYVVNIPTNYGLLVVPGSGQVLTVTWS